MRTVEFLQLLDKDNMLRVEFEIEQKVVLKFVVQLESRFGHSDNWEAVVRYDTAHGFAHCDRLYPYGEAVKTELTTKDYNEALTFAIGDLTDNWTEHRRRYEVWLNQ